MLTVGINAAPLLAPRTGVGRYIAGLLAALGRLSRPPAGPWRFQPLFATEAALAAAASGSSTPRAGRSPLDVLRRVARALPGGYRAADAARAVALLALRREGRLSLYHETNHAAPPFGGPVVVTIHDLSTLKFPGTQHAARARHFGRVLRERARAAARVVVPTAAIAREVQGELGVLPDRIVVAHHGLDKRFATGPRGTPKALLPHGVRGPYLLFVGAQDARKGLRELIAAYDALPAALQKEHALVLAGPEGTASQDVQDLLAGPRGGRIVRIGFVADIDLPALYRGAAALCLPSQYEGFGFPVAEAMACGVAVVASDDPSLVEIAGGAALHAKRGDAADLAAKLERLLSTPAVRMDLEQRGPKRAAAFDWEACARTHVGAYAAALGLEAVA